MQSSGDGINNVSSSISLIVKGTPENVKYVDDFFVSMKGYMPFYYTSPHENSEKKWTCEDWSVSYGNGESTLTAELNQDFTP